MPFIPADQLRKFQQLEEEVAKLKVAQDGPIPPPPQPEPEVPLAQYVPSELRNIVDEVLNKNFKVTVEAATDSPTFMFTIYVPEKYSMQTEEQRKMLQGDRRPRVISNAEGPSGVRQWAEKVYSSFNPEIQAQIVGDRISAL